MIERLLKIMMDWKDRKNKEMNRNQPNQLPLVDHRRIPGTPNNFCAAPEIDKILESQEQVIKASFGHQAVNFLLALIISIDLFLNVAVDNWM